MHRSYILYLIIVILSSGCTTALIEYPDVNYSQWSPSILIATPMKGRYLKAFKECLNDEYICMDPPPQAIEYDVISQVYGEEFPSYIEIATTSHYGLESYDFNNQEPELILIGSKNGQYVLPRYHRLQLAKLSSGEYAVPIFDGDELWWLPCSIKKYIKLVQFRSSIGISVEDAYDDLKKSKYVYFNQYVYIPAYAVSINDISAHLAKEKPLFKHFKCAN